MSTEIKLTIEIRKRQLECFARTTRRIVGKIDMERQRSTMLYLIDRKLGELSSPYRHHLGTQYVEFKQELAIGTEDVSSKF